ncbi:hypothetical protein C9374_011657 [Naegleria lovaniensis]|uniref:DUF4442 domain-containing protein n=1 Tax=Naegleria lovaniensis TaxID=51637 RepID=A0AA88GE89_NAELO|nr:uncharacterized protein C9374_011657 [Naegleria lovaniensis]KAG2373992.1 hypothetical protein C9374_011657 [Naegleria lovaniensis]
MLQTLLFVFLILLVLVLSVFAFLYIIPVLRVSKARPLKIYETIHALPFIGRTFLADYYMSRLIGFMAPYTDNIRPIIERMDEHETVVRITEKASMKNPFNSIHAAALVNLGDLVCGLQVTNQIAPRKLRAIPVEICAEYYKKSRGVIRGTCRDVVPLELSQMEMYRERPSFRVVAECRDESNELCALIKMIWSVAPQQQSSNQEKKQE